MPNTKWFAAALAAAVLLGGGALLQSAGAAEKPAREAADSDTAKKALERFKDQFDTVDIDFQQQAVRKLATVPHDSVAKRLIKLLKDDSEHLREVAAEGLGKQFTYAKNAGRKLIDVATDTKEQPRVMAAAITSVGHLEQVDLEPSLRRMITHDDDRVVVAVFNVYGMWKCPDALREMLNFFTKYPDEKEFKTGMVMVDTGAAGSEDQKAAEAKWKAKYGSQRAWRPRPDCTRALRAALKQITGYGFRRHEDLARYLEDPANYRDPEKVAERVDEPTRRKVHTDWHKAVKDAQAKSEKEVPGEEASDERAKVYRAELTLLRNKILDENGLLISELDVILEEGEAAKW